MNSKTLKLLILASAGLLTMSTKATELKIDELGTTVDDIFKFSNGTWNNVALSFNKGATQETFTFTADLKNGDLASGSSSVALLDADGTVSDVLIASWTLVPETRGSHDSFVITLYSDGGWPFLPTTTIAEPSGMGKVLQIGSAPSDVNIFVNSPDGTPTTTSVPDGGTTLVLLGAGVSGLALIRRKLS